MSGSLRRIDRSTTVFPLLDFRHDVPGRILSWPIVVGLGIWRGPLWGDMVYKLAVYI
jgi:hypothetical protein